MKRGLRQCESGVVYAEFLFAGLPVFMMFLTFVQLCLLFCAGVVVQHAANTAARSAIVVLDDANKADMTDDQTYMEGGLFHPLTSLGITGPGGHADCDSASQNHDRVASLMQGIQWDGGDGASGYQCSGKSTSLRLQTIAWAAIMKTLAISPLMASAREHGNSVKNALNPSVSKDDYGGDLDWIAQMANYAANATHVGVVLNPAAGATAPTVTVVVSYEFRCGVPAADLIVCSRDQIDSRANYIQGDPSQLPPGRRRGISAEATLPRLTPIYIPGTDHQ